MAHIPYFGEDDTDTTETPSTETPEVTDNDE